MSESLKLLSITLIAFLFAVISAGPQTRDHLTEQEADMVRLNQVIDKRIEVFVKAADRRLLVLANPSATQKEKEEEVWGPLPEGSYVELLTDYRRILLEAEEKLDDVLNRDSRNKELDKAVKKFKEAAMKHLPQLKALAPKMKDRREQRALEEAIAEAELVTQASGN